MDIGPKTDQLWRETCDAGTTRAGYPGGVSVAADSALAGPRTGVVIVAAGSGTRLGAGQPKAFVPVAGVPMLERALWSFVGLPGEWELAIVVPEGFEDEARQLAERAFGEYESSRMTLHLCLGGESRQASVREGLRCLSEQCDVILVHDAARCMASSALIERVAGAVRATHAGVIPALPIVDTIKRVRTNPSGSESIAETVSRTPLRAVQTPQGFPAAALRRAYEMAAEEYTDDAAIVSACGYQVSTIPGEGDAFKITTPADLRRAEQHVESFAPGVPLPSVGFGVDAHAFDPSCELWLAGLHWPGEIGLSGHSDGDAVAHAMCDALLSAAGLGDIGEMFGTEDPELEGAHSEVFLRRTRERLESHGYVICGVSAQFVSQRPRFASRRIEAERALSAVLGAPVSCSATTSDCLGFMGREEGVLAFAVATVQFRQ